VENSVDIHSKTAGGCRAWISTGLSNRFPKLFNEFSGIKDINLLTLHVTLPHCGNHPQATDSHNKDILSRRGQHTLKRLYRNKQINRLKVINISTPYHLTLFLFFLFKERNKNIMK